MIKIAERFQISPFLVFYLIHSLQFGVGVLGFQRIIAEKAGQDSWIVVIIAGILVHASLWMIYRILNGSNGNIVTVHEGLFGKWIGGILSFLFTLYFGLVAITVLRSYIEIVVVWMFPDLNIWLFSFTFLLLVYYIIMGGFRVVTGISFFGVVLPIYILLTFLFPLQFSEIRNLFPIFNHSVKDIALATKNMSLTIMGFESLLIYYPFIKNANKSKKWAHLSVAYTTLVYAFICIMTIIYFSEEQLEKTIWATLTIWKIIELPFVERFEYIGIANWIIIILPNICLSLWCASRCVKDVFRFKQKYSLIILLLVVYLAINFTKTREHVNLLNDIAGQIGFYVMFAYIPLIFLFTLIIRKVKGGKV
ncbi:GerAB/ArcD/ProY family transporter [Metabacillus litoralis]|jgi:spore germination protein AB|uniref:GerAB/ArcD/ProY family transporter n=1 Tax=Metabacillus litoralis TaxID=152268 RepID=UPI002041615C|nr:GerAB/ArcD/ProY family transporter [Metabacillus litoralis]MCM3652393.1 spore germination protein [Metabacillus litoralis]